MKLSKDNLKILKTLGFTRDKIHNDPAHDYYSLSNGWGFQLSAVTSWPSLMKRLYLGKAERIIDIDGIWKCRNWRLVAMDDKDYHNYQKWKSNEKV